MSTLLDPQTLANVQGLRLRAKHIVEGLIAGSHRSPHRGFSIEFAEHRDYAPGDDLRYLDWKVLGRTDKYYIKQFEDETNLICNLVVDVSESMQYKGPESALSKLEYAQCISATLAWLVLQQQDAVGLVTFDEQVRSLVPPSGSPVQLQQVIDVLQSAESKEKTQIGPLLHELSGRLSRRGLVIVLSDFFDDVDSIMAGLKHLRFRKHDIILMHVLDPAELDFPFDRPTMFHGLEAFPELLADPTSVRKAYREEVESFVTDLRSQALANQMDYVQVRTDQPLDAVLRNFFNHRNARLV
ncbi:DUF58 domain-containing protein [Bremerella sp. T1]|uniref:DUF58 domain-containing protein n=1 Tax=Bremerella sp. TYQ1 TaxID=3119568 RepID=UPI001CCB2E57|nr:DUF58 domain-containing protein [Bremerella volcania]UBM38497.1 DUF58 domain-containing protein [Bremerella volcania]